MRVYSRKKNSFQLSDKQFVWVAINARSKYNRWNEIEGTLQSEGIYLLI